MSMENIDQPQSGSPEADFSDLPTPEVSMGGLEEVLRGAATELSKVGRLRGYRELADKEGQQNGFQGQLYEDALTYELRVGAVCDAFDQALPRPDGTSWREVIESLPEAAAEPVDSAVPGTEEREELGRWEMGIQEERQDIERRAMARWR